MIYLFYGKDDYRIKQRLEEIIREEKKTSKNLNLKNLQGSYRDFKDEFSQVPMFKEKNIFVLTDFFSDSDFKENFVKDGKKFADSQDLIIFCEKKDIPAKDSLLVFLKKNAKVEFFRPLQGEQLKSWIQKEARMLSAQMERGASEKLIEFVGNDLWRLANEIRKLAAYKKESRKIEREDVELMVKPNIEADIFKTIDALAGKDKKTALSLLHKHLEKGDTPLYLLSMITFQFRNIIAVKDLAERGQSLQKAGLHPYVAQKSSRQARSFTLDELKKIYRKIFQVDYKIKTGKLEASLALDLFIAEI